MNPQRLRSALAVIDRYEPRPNLTEILTKVGNRMPDTSAEKEIAFVEWIQRVPTRMLECRVNQHDWPDWSDRKRTKHTKHRSSGIIVIEVQCKRRCGTTLTRFLDKDGYYARGNIIRHFYDPDFKYLMPPGARGPGLTKERRAKLRRELVERQSEWITEE